MMTCLITNHAVIFFYLFIYLFHHSATANIPLGVSLKMPACMCSYIFLYRFLGVCEPVQIVSLKWLIVLLTWIHRGVQVLLHCGA